MRPGESSIVIDSDAIVIAEVFKKRTRQTPKRIIDICKRRLQHYDLDRMTHEYKKRKNFSRLLDGVWVQQTIF